MARRSLVGERGRSTAALRDAALPACFAAATVAAKANILATRPHHRTPAQRRDLRRIARQAKAVTP